MKTEPTPERLRQFAKWLGETERKLHLLRDNLAQEMRHGHLPSAMPEAIDTAFILGMTDVYRTALRRLARQIQASNKRAKPKNK